MNLINIIKGKYKKYKEIVNYLIVGGFTTVISLGSYYALVLTILDPKDGFQLQIANVVSWICSVTFAYITNKIFVFESKEKKVLKEASKFYMARISTLLIDMLFMFLFVSIISINDKIAKILVQLIILVLNYVFSKLVVFKKSENIDKTNLSIIE